MLFVGNQIILRCALTLPENNSLHMKMDGWKWSFPFGMAYVQGRTVSFSECIVWVLVAMNKDEKKDQESRDWHCFFYHWLHWLNESVWLHIELTQLFLFKSKVPPTRYPVVFFRSGNSIRCPWRKLFLVSNHPQLHQTGPFHSTEMGESRWDPFTGWARLKGSQRRLMGVSRPWCRSGNGEKMMCPSYIRYIYI